MGDFRTWDHTERGAWRIMNIQLNPETERLVREELESGHFDSVDEIIVQGIRARRETTQTPASETLRREAVENALHKAVPLNGASIRELLHEGHRL
jgi:Arc/MetJ-type ribon-helix-helix transcriptional regulator